MENKIEEAKKALRIIEEYSLKFVRETEGENSLLYIETTKLFEAIHKRLLRKNI